MYLDTKREGEAQTATPSLRGLIAWLETKDQTETYDWSNAENCVLGQYYRALGMPHTVRLIGFKTQADDMGIDVNDLCCIATDNQMDEGPRTFGGALKRARAFL